MSGHNASTGTRPSPTFRTLVDQAREHLGRRRHRELPALASQRRAAVAVTLFEHRDEACVLIIKRVARGLNAGQWALPGGRIEKGESSQQAALRELDEETGLACDPSDVVGRLDDIATGSGHVITPWVIASRSTQTLRRSPAEVASLHPIRLDRLLAPGVPRWRPTSTGPLLQMPLRHDMVIHAPTGAVLWQFAEVVLRGRDVAIDALAEPDFVKA